MYTLSSHVLDTTLGKPVKGITLTLTLPDGSTCKGETDNDGRFNQWGRGFEAGVYSLRFDCHDYLINTHGKSFYPYIDITFELENQHEGDHHEGAQHEGAHYHVPLLISPFGFSSYRGS